MRMTPGKIDGIIQRHRSSACGSHGTYSELCSPVASDNPWCMAELIAFANARLRQRYLSTI
ncbi:unnamed protein product [Periconia digitata]|uniref:Uncharacterized protein n=1 Tax=Periconia digitata TaxID=1303443 RepID=A0A9W4XKD3_9PLEO|nr:unnamed protein product [Periconia digitata]